MKLNSLIVLGLFWGFMFNPVVLADTFNLEEELVSELKAMPTGELKSLNASQKQREDTAKLIHFSAALEDNVLKLNLLDDPDVQRQLLSARRDILLNALVMSDLEGENAGDVEKVAKENYELEKENFIIPRKIKIAQIYVKKKPCEPKWAENKIHDISVELTKENADFKKIVIDYSDDEKNRDLGGEFNKWFLEPRDDSRLSAPMKAAFQLKNVGDVSEAIESSHGYHIIKLLGATPSKMKSYVDVKGEIVASIQKQLWNERKEYIVKSLRPNEEFKYDDGIYKKQIDRILSERNKLQVK